ncbi:hypothetical protein [Actibacterium ureilyticum]|uniref:hypothetical protein n=1 Tax=Actibacterium ureilyticum TaxID=1590614 RepID=UPI000BAAF832|nr:hypothetical protein [Actibacterium ureilyticum]
MQYDGLDRFLAENAAALKRGPVAMIFVEDPVEVASTIRHHLKIGFPTLLVLAPPQIAIDEDLADRIIRIDHMPAGPASVAASVNAVIAAAGSQWLYYCFNAEYLFFPYCETRAVGELLAFHTEERRDAMLCYVIDLYAGDLGQAPNAVALGDAHLDRSGYYALARKDADADWAALDRQMDFYGGLRWRFEEHVPWERRKIDRIALFRAKPGLTLRPDHTFSEPEYNTYACPWHHNLTATICSFRTAKALKTNPGSRDAISTFQWRSSTPFEWNSKQLLELGLMEPGQWF